MSDATLEKKMQLIQQVRSRYNENQYDLSNREQLLYGTTSYYDASAQPDEDAPPLSTFKLRLFVAMVLFGLFIFMDRSHTAIGGITSEKLYGMISADYEEKMEEWVEAMSGSVQNK